jgi:hypothetical protein
MADDVLAMSLTCTKCGHTVKNDMPEITDWFQFHDALRQRGWFICEKQSYNQTHKCDRCASST